MGLERTALPTSWGRIGPECLNLTVPFQSIATPSAELEYVSDHDGGFKQPLERCKLLTRWAFEYFDQTRRDFSKV